MEYGIFNAEGCLLSQIYNKNNAEVELSSFIADGEDPDDVWIDRVCEDHEEQPYASCEFCWAEEEDDDDDDE